MFIKNENGNKNLFKLNSTSFAFLYFTSLYLLSSLSLITCDSEADKIDVRIYQEVKNSIHFDSMDEFQEWVFKNDVTFLTYYYSRNDTFSKMGAYYLYQLENKLDYLANIIFINCDEVKQRDTIKECNIKDSKGNFIFPRMKLAVPSKQKYNPFTKQVDIHNEVAFRESSVSSEIMFDFIVKNLISHTTNITSTNIKSFLQRGLLNKVLIFHDENNKNEDLQFQRLIKGLSNIFYDRILIGEVRNNTLAQEYKVKKFPKVVILVNSFFRWDSPETIIVDKPLDGVNLASILQTYSTREKLYLRRLYEHSLEDVKAFPLYAHTYHLFMEKFKKATKIVFFMNSDSLLTPDFANEITAYK